MAEKYDEELLLGYVEGDLDARSRAQVEAWIQQDPRLGRLLAAMREDRNQLRAMPDPATPDWLMNEVDQQLERAMLVDEPQARTSAETLRKRHVLRRILVVASIAAMVAVVGGVVIYSLQPTGHIIGDLAMRTPKAAKSEEVALSPGSADKTPQPSSTDSLSRTDTAAAKPADRLAQLSVPPSKPAATTLSGAAEPTSTAMAGAPGPVSTRAAGTLSSISDAPVAPAVPQVAMKAGESAAPASGAAAPMAPVALAQSESERVGAVAKRVAQANASATTMAAAPPPATPPLAVLRGLPASAAKPVAAAPAGPSQIRILSRDPAATLKQVRELASKQVVAPADAPQNGQPVIDVAAADLPKLLQTLRESPASVSVDLVPLPAGHAEADRASEKQQAETPGEPPLWPSFDADYKQFFRARLKEVDGEGLTPEVKKTLRMPVVIEAAPPLAPVTEKKPASKAEPKPEPPMPPPASTPAQPESKPEPKPDEPGM
jgi:hypothetical protein